MVKYIYRGKGKHIPRKKENYVNSNIKKFRTISKTLGLNLQKGQE